MAENENKQENVVVEDFKARMRRSPRRSSDTDSRIRYLLFMRIINSIYSFLE